MVLENGDGLSDLRERLTMDWHRGCHDAICRKKLGKKIHSDETVTVQLDTGSLG